MPRAHIGLDGRFIALNDGFCDLVGYSEEEFSDAYWPPVVDAEHRSELRRATARLIAGELAHSAVDTVYMAGNGTLVPVVGTLRLERDASGAATHLVLDAQPRAVVSA
jgi:PAS domain S-box-containing protein